MQESWGATWVKVPQWQRIAWLCHGFSTRAGGGSLVYSADGLPEMNLGLTPEDDAGIVQRNRELATQSIGGTRAALATVRQVHGTEVLFVSQPGRAGDADGLVTSTPGLMLGVLAADCVPILVADLRLRVVGAFHAGWRGTAAGIASAGIARMREQGSRPEDMVAAIGPSIGPCCYEVGEEVRQSFPQGAYRGNALDLWESNRRQLTGAGLRDESVTVLGECTACTRLAGGQRKFFSHRAEKGITGRAMGMIGIGLET